VGTVHGTTVAAKSARKGLGREMLLTLLSEIKLMSLLEPHPNIVSFLGASTKKIAKGNLINV